jgi:hypothetical protein
MRKQRGVTMIGWIFLLAPVAVVLYAGIRVAPEYLNYYKVITALKETASQFKGEEAINPTTVRGGIDKRFDTGYIDDPKAKDIAITRDESGWVMVADYEKVVPLFGNLHLLMVFKTTVPIS